MNDTPHQYWTPEFTDLFVAELNRDPVFQKAARKFIGRVIMRALDAPGGKDVETVYHIDRGRVSVQSEHEDAPSRAIRNRAFDKHRAMARTTAPYPMWCKLDRGEMNVLQAIASPDYQVEGSKLKVMSNVGMFNAMTTIARRLPKRY